MPHAVVRRRLADDLPERAVEGPRAGEAAMGARPRSNTSTKVDTKNPVRGPLLIISGEKDNTVPWAIANASYKRQKRNQAVTEIIEMPNRGHGLVIDSGWREVADTALTFVQRFVR
jgi:non-heme chloroperoxidase